MCLQIKASRAFGIHVTLGSHEIQHVIVILEKAAVSLKLGIAVLCDKREDLYIVGLG